MARDAQQTTKRIEIFQQQWRNVEIKLNKCSTEVARYKGVYAHNNNSPRRNEMKWVVVLSMWRLKGGWKGTMFSAACQVHLLTRPHCLNLVTDDCYVNPI